MPEIPRPRRRYPLLGRGLSRHVPDPEEERIRLPIPGFQGWAVNAGLNMGRRLGRRFGRWWRGEQESEPGVLVDQYGSRIPTGVSERADYAYGVQGPKTTDPTGSFGLGTELEMDLAEALAVERLRNQMEWSRKGALGRAAQSAGVGVSRTGSGRLVENFLQDAGVDVAAERWRELADEGVIRTNPVAEFGGMGGAMLLEIAALKRAAAAGAGLAPTGSRAQRALSMAGEWALPTRKQTTALGMIEGLPSDIGMYLADPSIGIGSIPMGMLLGGAMGALTPLSKREVMNQVLTKVAGDLPAPRLAVSDLVTPGAAEGRLRPFRLQGAQGAAESALEAPGAVSGAPGATGRRMMGLEPTGPARQGAPEVPPEPGTYASDFYALKPFGPPGRFAARTGAGAGLGGTLGYVTAPEGEEWRQARRGALAGAAIGNIHKIAPYFRHTGKLPFESAGEIAARELAEATAEAAPEVASSGFREVPLAPGELPRQPGRFERFYRPERVRRSVVRLGDEVFEGPSHFAALEQVWEKYGYDVPGIENAFEGFSTNYGNIIPKREALERFGGYGSEDLLSRNEGVLSYLERTLAGMGLGALATMAGDPEGESGTALPAMVLTGLGVPGAGKVARGVTRMRLETIGDLARVLGVRQNVDRFFNGKTLRELSDAERAQVIRSWNMGREAPRTMVRPEGAPRAAWIQRSNEELARYAMLGRAGKEWYQRSLAAIQAVMGEETRAFMGFLAAHSPNTGPEMNLMEALQSYSQWKKGLPISGVGPTKKLGSEMIMQGQELQSPKIWSFMMNLLGYGDHVTNDIWNMRALAGITPDMVRAGEKVDANAVAKRLKDAGVDYAGPEFDGMLYSEARDAIRELADYLTRETGEKWTAMEAQAALWTGFRDSFNRRVQGLPERVVPRSEVDDFGSLINTTVARNDPVAAPYLEAQAKAGAGGFAFVFREPSTPVALGEMLPSPGARKGFVNMSVEDRIRYAEDRLRIVRPRLVAIFEQLGMDPQTLTYNLDKMSAAIRKWASPKDIREGKLVAPGEAGTYQGLFNTNVQLRMPEGTPEWKVRAMTAAMGRLMEQDFIPYSIRMHNSVAALRAVEDIRPSQLTPGQVQGDMSAVVHVTRQHLDHQAGQEIARALKEYQERTGVELNFTQTGDQLFFGDYTFSDLTPREFAEHVSQALDGVSDDVFEKYLGADNWFYTRMNGDYLGKEWDGGEYWNGLWRDALDEGAATEPQVSGLLSRDVLDAHYRDVARRYNALDQRYRPKQPGVGRKPPIPEPAAAERVSQESLFEAVDPGVRGFAEREVLATGTGAAVGGLLGAGYDKENRVRGAIAGAVAGGLGAYGLDRFGARMARQAAEAVPGATPSPRLRPKPEDLEKVVKRETTAARARAAGKDYPTEELFGKTSRWAEDLPDDVASLTEDEVLDWGVKKGILGDETKIRQTLENLKADPTGEAILERQMQETAIKYGTEFKERVSWAEGRKMARKAGLDPDLLDVEGMSRMQMINILDVTKTNARRIRDIELRLSGRDPTNPAKAADELLPSEREALREEAALLESQSEALFSKFMRVRTEFGRALQSLKMLGEVTRQADGTLNNSYWVAKAKKIAQESGYGDLTDDMVQMIRDYAAAGDEEGMIRYIAMLRQPNVAQQVMTLWKAGLLTNPATHVANLIGNTSMMTMEALKDRPAYLLDRLFATFTGMRTVGRPGRGGTLYGFMEGLSEAGDVMRGKAPADIQKLDQVMEVDINLPFLPKTMKEGREVNFFLDTYQKSVYRALAAGDRPFRKAAFNRSLREQANLMAEQSGEKAAYWLANPTDEMVLRAITDAEVSIFVNRGLLGALGSQAKRFAWDKSPVAGAVAEHALPFTMTPANIVSRVVEYSGLGYIGMLYDLGRALVNRTEVRPGSFFDLKGLPDAAAAQRRAAQRGGRATVGLTAVMAGYLLHHYGMMTGEYPSEALERNLWQAQGKASNALRLPGWDKYLSTERISPLGNLVAFGAELGRAMDREGWGSMEAVGSAAMSVPRYAVSQSFLRGIQQSLDFVTSRDDGLGRSNFERYMQNLGSSMVPNIFRTTARVVDPVMRTRKLEGYPAEDFLGGITASTPFFSKMMPPRRDVFGYERSRLADPGLGARLRYGAGQFLSPLTTTPDLTTRFPENKLLSDVGYAPRNEPRMKAEGESLWEYDQRQIQVGIAVMDAVQKLMNDERFLAKPREDQQEQLRRAISDARSDANKPFRERYKARREGG